MSRAQWLQLLRRLQGKDMMSWKQQIRGGLAGHTSASYDDDCLLLGAHADSSASSGDKERRKDWQGDRKDYSI